MPPCCKQFIEALSKVGSEKPSCFLINEWIEGSSSRRCDPFNAILLQKSLFFIQSNAKQIFDWKLFSWCRCRRKRLFLKVCLHYWEPTKNDFQNTSQTKKCKNRESVWKLIWNDWKKFLKFCLAFYHFSVVFACTHIWLRKAIKKIYIHQLRKGTKYLGLSGQESEAFFVKLKYFVMCQCRHYHRHVCQNWWYSNEDNCRPEGWIIIVSGKLQLFFISAFNFW